MDCVAPTRIEWNTDDGVITLLPQMRSDIMLEHKGFTLIIDAKYYGSSLQTGQYGKKTIHSNNLYQIYSYVKNRDIESDGSVSGMLLYANTDSDNPDMEYHMGGNKISVKTLNLDCDFEEVKCQLDSIVNWWLIENGLECMRQN